MRDSFIWNYSLLRVTHFLMFIAGKHRSEGMWPTFLNSILLLPNLYFPFNCCYTWAMEGRRNSKQTNKHLSTVLRLIYLSNKNLELDHNLNTNRGTKIKDKLFPNCHLKTWFLLLCIFADMNKKYACNKLLLSMQHDLNMWFFFFMVWVLIEDKMPKFAMLCRHECRGLQPSGAGFLLII